MLCIFVFRNQILSEDFHMRSLEETLFHQIAYFEPHLQHNFRKADETIWFYQNKGWYPLWNKCKKVHLFLVSRAYVGNLLLEIIILFNYLRILALRNVMLLWFVKFVLTQLWLLLTAHTMLIDRLFTCIVFVLSLVNF